VKQYMTQAETTKKQVEESAQTVSRLHADAVQASERCACRCRHCERLDCQGEKSPESFQALGPKLDGVFQPDLPASKARPRALRLRPVK